MIKKISFSLCLAFFSIYANAQQKGTVSGTLHDGETNGVLPFADVFVKNSEKGTTSDFDGDYELKLKPGTYTVVFSFVGYQKKEINQVVVKSGQVFNLDVTLKPSAGQLDEVVISTTARRNTAKAVLNLQKNSVVQMDGLSLQTIKQSGVSNIAAAVKKVPGVSVQAGKYVYVRGLGDRYTKSILNGMDIPGLNPDKNSIQLDIFPTNILENILVTKTASADLPADFTGGIVNIVTKDFPSKEQFGVSASLGYNPDMNFKDNYLTYPGGDTDFLGFDDGTREKPVSKNTDIPNPAAENNQSIEGITRSFNKNLAARQSTSGPNFGLGVNYGNRYDVGDNKLGLIASLDYKNTTKFYEGFENGIYQKPENNGEFTLRPDRTRKGNLGQNNVLASGLAGLSYKTEKSKYKLNVLRIQNGESSAALFDQTTRISNKVDVVKNYLTYTQRSISNLLLSGKHTNEDASFITEWKVSPTIARSHDKDVRLTTFEKLNGGKLAIKPDAGYPQNTWRNLKEFDGIGKIDFTKKYELFGKGAKFKFGGLFSYKKRDYGIDNYTIKTNKAGNTEDLNGDPDKILAPENIYTAESDKGYYVQGNYEPANNFSSNQQTGALYVSNEFNLAKKLKAIIGLRAEQYRTYFTGENNQGDVIFDNEKTIDKLDFFPSANFIYSVKDNMKLRFSYSRTTARPTFKEKSIVQIPDLLTGLTFLGNLDLKPSYIENLDLRYEFYGDGDQMFAVSGFYKMFKDPIELVAYSNISPDQLTPRNAPSADVFGVEFEARKNFGFISEDLKNLGFRVNASFIQSKIKMNKGPNKEYQSRLRYAREGQKIDDTRELQGQSPYLINAGLTYDQSKIGLKTGVFYNVQGKTLEVVGLAQNPDVFVKPFNSLDFSISKTLGKTKNSTLSFKVENILDSERKQFYDAFKAENKNFRLRRPGREISLGYSLKF